MSARAEASLVEAEPGHTRTTQLLRTCKQAKASVPSTLVVSMLIQVLPTNVAIRNAIRQTWFQDANHLRHRKTFCDSPRAHPQLDDRPVCIDARFFVGMGQLKPIADTAFWNRLAHEIQTHGDIVVLPVVEWGDHWGSMKTAAVLDWVAAHRAYADYAIKLDTDTYVYLPRFIQHLPMPRKNELILVGRRHPRELFRDYQQDDYMYNCPGGELYGFSQGLLELMASQGYANESMMDILFVPTESGSRWTNAEDRWAYEWEDVFVCAMVDRTMARYHNRTMARYHNRTMARYHNRTRARYHKFTLNYRLLDPGHGLWLHSGAIKNVSEYWRCHQVGVGCRGERGTRFTRPAAFDPMKCR